ncbi:MAG: hypothetical protein ABEI98_11355 [Halorhabdus sp.]
MHARRIGRLVYLLAFLVVQQFTTIFTQYPTLELLGMVGVAIVGLDALVCAIRRWRSLDATVFDSQSADS